MKYHTRCVLFFFLSLSSIIDIFSIYAFFVNHVLYVSIQCTIIIYSRLCANLSHSVVVGVGRCASFWMLNCVCVCVGPFVGIIFQPMIATIVYIHRACFFLFLGRLLYFYLHFSIHAMAKILIHIFLMWLNWSGIHTQLCSSNGNSIFKLIHLLYWLWLPLSLSIYVIYVVHCILFSTQYSSLSAEIFAKMKINRKSFSECWRCIFHFPTPFLRFNQCWILQWKNSSSISFAFLTLSLLWSSFFQIFFIGRPNLELETFNKIFRNII